MLGKSVRTKLFDQSDAKNYEQALEFARQRTIDEAGCVAGGPTLPVALTNKRQARGS